MDGSAWRLGLKLGADHLGWWVIRLDAAGQAAGLGPGGVRVYAGGGGALDRRVARSARRRRDRFVRRRSALLDLLVAHGLMPPGEAGRKALEAIDPYTLRATALDVALPVHQVGRALFHLNQRRGFLSNRKTERDEAESGAIKRGAAELAAAMERSGARTLGEFLHGRHQARLAVRARNRSAGPKAEYEFYPTRQLVLDEFDSIWRAQARHHPAMTEAARAAIHRAMFFQRPLKPPPVGKCALSPATGPDDIEGFRCPRAHPLAQRFRIWQEVRNLGVVMTGGDSYPLDKAEGDKIALALLGRRMLSFDAMRGLLGLPSEARFNLESERRQMLLGDETAASLARANLFGKGWRGLPPDRQTAIVTKLLDEPDEAALVAWLGAEAGLDADRAGRVASAFLPQGHGRLGLRAIKALLPHMEGGLTYPEAAEAAGLDFQRRPTGALALDGKLPYYGEWLQDEVVGSGDPADAPETRWGRFPNPAVHVALNQARRVVNALIQEFGAPAQITVQVGRELKLSRHEIAEIEREQAANQRRNDERRSVLREHGLATTRHNLLKLRLWEELNQGDPLDRRCPFSGEVISLGRLFSDDVEIDYLIPYRDSLDDGAANKILCLRTANRAKNKQTPFEAFGTSPTINGRAYDWAAIAARADGLPYRKRWRFQPDARARFDAQGGAEGRHLNEAAWRAQLVRRYLAAVTDPRRIDLVPGFLTPLLRAKWGLDELLPDHNWADARHRSDHRHYALDALVTGLTDRALLGRMAQAAAETEDRPTIAPPWASLRNDVANVLDRMTVSHRPDHGVAARLHEATAYGRVTAPEPDGGNLVYRKPFLMLNENEIARIRDARLRDLVTAHAAAARADGIALKAALQSFAARTDIPGLPAGIRHVRLTKREDPAYLVPVRDAARRAYKFHSAGEYAFVDLFEDAAGKWRGAAMSVFAANQKDAAAQWPTLWPGARPVMRIFKGDPIALERDGRRVVMIVHRLDASLNQFKLAAHHEGGPLGYRHDKKRVEYANDPFRWLMAGYSTLQKMKAEPIRIDVLGRIWRLGA